MLILVLMHKRICPILKWRFWGNHSQTRFFVLVRAHIIPIVILWCGEGTHISNFVFWRYNKSSNFDIWVLRENEVHLWTFGFDETTTISNFAFWVSMKQPIFQTLKLCFEGNTIASNFCTWISFWKNTNVNCNKFRLGILWRARTSGCGVLVSIQMIINPFNVRPRRSNDDFSNVSV